MTDRAGDIVTGEDSNLVTDLACDIAIWLRVHVDPQWTSEHEAVRSLARHLERLVER